MVTSEAPYNIGRRPLIGWKKSKNNHRFLEVVERFEIEGKETSIFGFPTKQSAIIFKREFLCK